LRLPEPLLRRGVGWLVAALLGLHVWMAASVSPSHSVTADEIAHLTAGYAYWTRNDYRFQPENGNLPQRLGALPLLLADVRFSPPDHSWRISDVWKAGYDFFYTQGNDPAAMLQLSRSAMALLGAVTGLGIFLWSRRLWGTGGGLLALTLWCFCPNALAHAGLVTSDMAATGAFLGAITLCWWSMQQVNWWRILAAGLVAGFLAVSKFSAPLLAPVVLVLVLVRVVFGPTELHAERFRLRGILAKIAILLGSQFVVALIALAVLWSAYGWRHSMYAGGEKLGQVRNLVGWDVLESDPSLPLTVVWWARDHALLPEAYSYGFAHAYRFSRHRRSFLKGDYRSDGWVGFFPYTSWVKTPPAAWLILLAVACGWLVRATRRGDASPSGTSVASGQLYLAAPLVVFGYVYACSMLSSGLNIGHRHALPLYPLLYILLGGAWPLLTARSRVGKVTVLALLGALVGESFASRPSYLAYFNFFDGGPREAYRHVVDSSLDWGQDLPALRAWLSQNPKRTPVYLSYFGSADPIGEGIAALRVGDHDFDWHPRASPVEMGPGVYCISATMLQQVYSRARGPWDSVRRARLAELEARFSANEASENRISEAEKIELEHYRFAQLCTRLRFRDPDGRAGHSVLIYHVGPEEFAAAMGAPSRSTQP
jgi:hypothetical protein